MFGQGIAGILACLLNFVVMLLLNGASFEAAVAYYMLAALSMIGCIIAYSAMLRRPFTRYWISRAIEDRLVTSIDAPISLIAKDNSKLDSNETVRDEERCTDTIKLLADTDIPVSRRPPEMPIVPVANSLCFVTKSLWREGLTVWLIFTVTFTIFPGIVPYHLTFDGSKSFNLWWQQVQYVCVR